MKKSLPALFIAILLSAALNGQPSKVGEFEDSSGEPTEFMTDMSNQYIAVGNELGIVTVMDFESQNELYKIRPHREPVEFIRFHTNNGELITATENEIIFSGITDGAQSSKISIFGGIEAMELSGATNKLYILAQRKQVDLGATKHIYKIDLTTRKFESVHTATGISDFRVSADGEMLYIAKGSKILIKNIALSLVENELQSRDGKDHIDIDLAKPDWIASNDKLMARYWKISSGQSYQLRWDPMASMDETFKIDQVWVLAKENNLLFFGSKGLKIRDIKDPNSDLIINSPTGLDIRRVRVSPDRTKVLIVAQRNLVEIWSLGASKPVANNQQVSTQATKTAPVQISGEDAIYSKYKAEIDKEMSLRAELFAPRGEFERSADYDKRQAAAKKYKAGVLDYYRGVANREADVAAELELARKKIIAERSKEDSVRKASLYKDKIVASYEEFYTRITSVGTYNPDREEFPITIDEMTHLVKVPFDEARAFKEGSPFYKVVGTKQLLQDAVTLDKFNYKIITDAGKTFSFGKQKRALFITGEHKLLQTVLQRSAPSQTTQPPVSATNTSPSSVATAPKNAVDRAIVNYFQDKKYHALLIGVSEYADHRITQLNGPIQDANKLKEVLMRKYTFQEENITFLQNPTRTEIIETFDKLQLDIGDKDNLLVFYAGHGIWDENLKQGFWLPSNSKIDSKAEWLSNARIRDYIGGINAKHTLLVADACFSGGIFKTRDVFIQNRASLELAKLPSRKAITSGAMKTVPDKSVFIEYLIKRLEQNDNILLPTEQLFSSFKIAVMNNSEGQVPQYGDIQGAGDEGGDFVFLKRGY